MQIRTDDLSHPLVHALLQEHWAGMHANTPAGHVHALDLMALRSADITFWTAWRDNNLLGCGALKALDAQHGEIKSMRTSRAHLRQGAAQQLLSTIETEARRRGYARLSLETGSSAAFMPAHALYTRNGFTPCAAFGEYVANAFSVFMCKNLR